MPKSIEALVEPELLMWARDTAGLEIPEVARKIDVKPERIESWERGEKRPTIVQLRKLARVYKRPIAVFFLSSPPGGRFKAMHDFRRLPISEAMRQSPELRFEIRRSQFRRDIALELYDFLGEQPPGFQTSISLSDSPEDVAVQLRELTNVSYENQMHWRTSYDALNGWRAALEDLGILFFQAPNIELKEMRGFSLSEKPLPVITVNTRDTVNGRIFTALHEFVHIVLDENGLCNNTEGWLQPTAGQDIEVFCNRVAGAILVPQTYLLREELVRKKGSEPYWSDPELDELARGYNVSRETILRRLLIVGRTTEPFYQAKREQFTAEYEALSKRKKKSAGGPTPDKIAVARSGYHFTRLVLNSYYNETITASDVSEYLDVRLRHVPAIEATVFD